MLLVIALTIGFTNAMIAISKRRSVAVWVTIGLAVSFVGMLLAILMPANPLAEPAGAEAALGAAT